MSIPIRILHRRLISRLAASPQLRNWANRYGLRLGVNRFVAGETMADGLDCARSLNIKCFKVTLDLLGESVSNARTACQAGRSYRQLLEAIKARGLEANISVKPSQLGLGISYDLAVKIVTQLVAEAAKKDNFVRMDMESSHLVQPTLGYRQQFKKILR